MASALPWFQHYRCFSITMVTGGISLYLCLYHYQFILTWMSTSCHEISCIIIVFLKCLVISHNKFLTEVSNRKCCECTLINCVSYRYFNWKYQKKYRHVMFHYSEKFGYCTKVIIHLYSGWLASGTRQSSGTPLKNTFKLKLLFICTSNCVYTLYTIN